MDRLEALRILEAKLGAIEEEHHTEIAGHEELREPINAKAEARALGAVFDFLKDCKIAPTDSLLRIFRRYLHPKSSDQTPLVAQRRSRTHGQTKG
jgi:hypothetical protein